MILKKIKRLNGFKLGKQDQANIYIDEFNFYYFILFVCCKIDIKTKQKVFRLYKVVEHIHNLIITKETFLLGVLNVQILKYFFV